MVIVLLISILFIIVGLLLENKEEGKGIFILSIGGYALGIALGILIKNNFFLKDKRCYE